MGRRRPPLRLLRSELERLRQARRASSSRSARRSRRGRRWWASTLPGPRAARLPVRHHPQRARAHGARGCPTNSKDERLHAAPAGAAMRARASRVARPGGVRRRCARAASRRGSEARQRPRRADCWCRAAQFISGDLPGRPPLAEDAADRRRRRGLPPLSVVNVEVAAATRTSSPGAAGQVVHRADVSDGRGRGRRAPRGHGDRLLGRPGRARRTRCPRARCDFSVQRELRRRRLRRALTRCASSPSTAAATAARSSTRAALHRVAHPRQRPRVRLRTSRRPRPSSSLAVGHQLRRGPARHHARRRRRQPEDNPLADPVDAGQPPASDPPHRPRLARTVRPRRLAPGGPRLPGLPGAGPYDIYADPFAACGQTAVRFT